MTVIAFEVVIGSSKQTDRETRETRQRDILQFWKEKDRQNKQTNKKEIQNVTNKKRAFFTRINQNNKNKNKNVTHSSRILEPVRGRTTRRSGWSFERCVY